VPPPNLGIFILLSFRPEKEEKGRRAASYGKDYCSFKKAVHSSERFFYYKNRPDSAGRFLYNFQINKTY
jgi:hypothetical protein